jgi:parallel beta-helix repeat protein
MDKGMELFFIAIGAICALMLTSGVVCAADIFVGPSETYTTIQSAENVAVSYDTIIVRDGIYPENVDVDVAHLTIRSENGSANCIVEAANPNDHVFEVTADYVNITGFTVKNATNTWGILLFFVERCNISDNCVLYNYNGIGLDGSYYNDIIGNTVNMNKGHGIGLGYSNNNNITGNTANMNGGDGIDLGNAWSNDIIGNTVNMNEDDGIDLYYSRFNNISCNLVYNNTGAGFYLTQRSTNNTIEYNNIMANGIYNGTSGGYEYNFYNEQSDNVTAEDNYWGTTSSVVIAASIYQGPGLVDYEPFLDFPASCAPFEAPVSPETPEVPTLTPIGLIALVSALSAIAVAAIVRKRR